MGKTEEDGGLNAEVTSRLDELFAEDDDSGESDISGQEFSAEQSSQADKQLPDEQPVVEDSPVRELKALVFGIDWEITDDTMVAFLDEVRRLRSKYNEDRILSMYLKLHESIGKYIKAKKVRAHPDAIKFVTSVFKNFEKILIEPDLPENRKKRLLAGDIKTFKEFKERVISREKTPVKEETATEVPAEITIDQDVLPPEDGESPVFSSDQKEALDYLVGELKKTIKAEFLTIRQILKNLGT